VKKERAQGLWDNEEVDTPGVKTMEGEVEGVADVEEIIKRVTTAFRDCAAM
jgi:hypothetical protein